MDWFEELMYNGGDNENKERMITSKQLNKIVDIIPTTVLRGLSAKEVKTAPNDSIYIGTDMASYGDWTYYITPECEVVRTYYSIGD
jgi:hypothetical protein